ncbi:MAG: tellurite resistance/C4-dicarboxylate transporter family protein [Bacteroidales bacterium]|jgi:tellurite resistance protein TehA-like permease|nr:tellurite resistance/C4-dicarboxylate transporter family protein [Bacteroidales bacterium]MDD4384643.1 tellurite resistance/C4-dicarboxylate transporter family protein [Bacteroidales bacterium]MDY0197113.1 tellurite resistance/C4-dicarboxylate transporter family protein [Tenuifilaceae bacterium]
MEKTKLFASTFLHDLKNLHTAYFALVMATGIVSIAAHNYNFFFVSKFLFHLNIGAYLFLSAMYILRVIFYFPSFSADASDHAKSPGLLTFVAGSCVLGSQFVIILENFQIATLLFYTGAIAWLAIIYTVFTSLTVKKEKPAINNAISGVWLLIIVSTQSVSILGAQLANYLPFNHEQTLFFSLIMFLCGCMFYIIVITLIVYRMSFFSMKAEEFAPPYWINMGAVAISTLAGSTLILNAPSFELLTSILPFLKGFTLFYWAIGTWWIPLIVILGIWRHIFKQLPLKYHPQYWGMIFPMGMYTVCTFKLSQALGLPFLMAIPSFFVYIAIVAWGIAAAGMFYSIGRDYLFVSKHA